MQAASAVQGKDLLVNFHSSNKPLPLVQPHIGIKISPGGNASDGEEKATLTPRQEPQGEESIVPEPSVPPSKYNFHTVNSHASYQRQSSNPEQSHITKKVHANSSPIQASDYLHHNFSNKQSKSLDLSPSQDQSATVTSGLVYNPPPAYGASISLSQGVMHDKSQVLNSYHSHQQGKNALNIKNAQGIEHILPPPPEYPGNKADIRRSYEVLDTPSLAAISNLHQSSSQPELAHTSTSHNQHGGKIVSSSNYNVNNKRSNDQDFAAVATRASKMVEVLSEENKSLRSELESYYRKVSKLQKFELELQKVHEAHENLVKSSVKKEGIEKAIRMRQDMDLKKLEEANKQYKDKISKFEKRLTEQNATINELKTRVVQQDDTLNQLTSLNADQKEQLERTSSKIESLLRNLETEKLKSRSLEEELTAYKSNASAIMEEESEVRMAALQQSTKDSERIIQEAQAEKLRYMDEAHQACKKVAHLEARLKALEASCAEKDAMVRVLQRRQRSNLSGRGQPPPSIHSTGHSKQSSEPSTHKSQLSINEIVQMEQLSPSDTLEAQTWQV